LEIAGEDMQDPTRQEQISSTWWWSEWSRHGKEKCGRRAYGDRSTIGI